MSTPQIVSAVFATMFILSVPLVSAVALELETSPRRHRAGKSKLPPPPPAGFARNAAPGGASILEPRS